MNTIVDVNKIGKNKIKIVSERDPNIWAIILKDSVSTYTGSRIVSFHVHYPRCILAEVNTHRMFSRNSSSSRAVPVAEFLKIIFKFPFVPVFWGKNERGMVANSNVNKFTTWIGKMIWFLASKFALFFSWSLMKLNVHKQLSNRLTETFQYINTIITATEFDNFFELRDHPDAEPHFHELAKCMRQAMEISEPQELAHGEWHLPFITSKRNCGILNYYIGDQDSNEIEIDLETAKQISSSCCAQISYRKSDTSKEKAVGIWERLFASKPRHASPFEHQAMALLATIDFPDGVTHRDRNGNWWSGNLKGWVQYRHLLEHK